MDTPQSKKMMIVNILEILKKYSDEKHRLTQKDFIRLLKEDYAMDADRKAIRRNLTNLMEAGYPIGYDESVRAGMDGEEESLLTNWYLERDFTEPELRLLIDGLFFSRQIPLNHRKQLIEKLEKLSSRYFTAKVRHISTMPVNEPANQDLFLNIEVLDDAISQHKKVTFYYIDYAPDKKLHYRLNKQGEKTLYVFNPYQMAATNGRYYLIGNHDAHDNVSHLRIDRIKNIQISQEPVKPMRQVRGLENGLDLPKHLAEHVYMYAGESVLTRFLAPESMTNDLVDWFGMDFSISQTVPAGLGKTRSGARGETDAEDGAETDGRMMVTVKINRQAMFYWAMQYGRYIEVLEPADLREELKQAAESMAERYGT